MLCGTYSKCLLILVLASFTLQFLLRLRSFFTPRFSFEETPRFQTINRLLLGVFLKQKWYHGHRPRNRLQLGKPTVPGIRHIELRIISIGFLEHSLSLRLPYHVFSKLIIYFLSYLVDALLHFLKLFIGRRFLKLS